MSFDRDPSKKVQEVVFSRKLLKPVHTPLIFNNRTVSQAQESRVFQNDLK